MSADPDPSTGRLVVQVTEDLTTLVRDELQLARADLAESGRRLGVGVGALGASGVIALYGLGALVATAIIALAQAVEPWAAALTVSLCLFAVAAVGALIGRARVRSVPEPPRERVESVQADVDVVRQAGDEGTSA